MTNTKSMVCDAGIKDLQFAVVERAVIDYKNAYKKLNYSKKKLDNRTENILSHKVTDLRRWFLSDDLMLWTDIPGQDILNKLETDIIKEMEAKTRGKRKHSNKNNH